MTLADKIALLNNGIIQQIGTPKEIHNTPKNIFVAKFLGSPPMNILEACDIVQSNQKISVGIRPEYVIFHEDNQENSFPISIELIENIGTEFLIHTFINEQIFVIKTTIKPKVSEIYIQFHKEKVRFFNNEEQRII